MSLFTDSPIECLQNQLDSMRRCMARVRVEHLFAPTVEQAENARKIAIEKLTFNIDLYEKALSFLKTQYTDFEILPPKHIEL